jgi:hypothetical protein
MCDFSSRAFSPTISTRTSNKPQALREKYAKEDQPEQVMSAVVRDGTCAEVAFTASYSFRCASRASPWRVAHHILRSHDLDSQRWHELDPLWAVEIAQQPTTGCNRNQVVSGIHYYPPSANGNADPFSVCYAVTSGR